MARYKYGEYLEQYNDERYDEIHKPGETVPYSGIYRCKNCGDEIASNKDDPFPPQNHHQHDTTAPIRWQLLVRSVQKK